MDRINGKSVLSLVVGLFALMVFFGSWAIVPAGHRGIVMHLGQIQDEVLSEGFHFKMPFVTKVKSVSTRIQESSIKTQAASRDMQKVHTTLSLNWHISPDKVNEVFRHIGEPELIQETVINSAVSEVLKAATATMSAEEILSKRIELKDRIDESLVKRLSSFNITVDTVNLADFDFEPEFNRAVEEKQIAEQNAKKAEYLAEQATVDARAAVNKAKAEAEANSLKQKTLTSELIRYEAIQKWNGQLPSMMSGNAVPFINVNSKE